MSFKMKYTKGSFPFKQKPSPNKFLGGLGKKLKGAMKGVGKFAAGGGVLGMGIRALKGKDGGGGGNADAVAAARGAMGTASGAAGGLFGGMGPNLPGKMLKGGGRAPGKFPGFGAMGAGPRGAAALVKKDKNK